MRETPANCTVLLPPRPIVEVDLTCGRFAYRGHEPLPVGYCNYNENHRGCYLHRKLETWTPVSIPDSAGVGGIDACQYTPRREGILVFTVGQR